MKLAVVFPGQGSQAVGMGRDWYEHHITAREVFDEADDVLGFPLSRLCFEGPDHELRLTEHTQPAILTTSWAAYCSVHRSLPTPAFFAGHSLGEFTALVASGAMRFQNAVAIVKSRGRLMQNAVPVGQGAMAAVIGLDGDTIRGINEAVASELNQPLEIANFNNLEQIVVSGAAAALAAALPRYTEAGAKRVVELPVSAPFHSSMMVPAADGLLSRLEEIGFRPCATPVIANLTASPYPADPHDYHKILYSQIFNSVRWTETVQYFADQGVTHLLEVGPGKVLRMLTPKITKEIRAANVETIGQVDEMLEWLALDTEAEG